MLKVSSFHFVRVLDDDSSVLVILNFYRKSLTDKKLIDSFNYDQFPENLIQIIQFYFISLIFDVYHNNLLNTIIIFFLVVIFFSSKI